jgi:hypothetical protein
MLAIASTHPKKFLNLFLRCPWWYFHSSMMNSLQEKTILKFAKICYEIKIWFIKTFLNTLCSFALLEDWLRHSIALSHSSFSKTLMSPQHEVSPLPLKRIRCQSYSCPLLYRGTRLWIVRMFSPKYFVVRFECSSNTNASAMVG